MGCEGSFAICSFLPRVSACVRVCACVLWETSSITMPAGWGDAGCWQVKSWDDDDKSRKQTEIEERRQIQSKKMKEGASCLDGGAHMCSLRRGTFLQHQSQ